MQPGWKRSTSPRLLIVALLYLLKFFSIQVPHAFATAEATSDATLEHIKAIVNDLRTQLEMSADVEVTIAAQNIKMVSVEHLGPARDSGSFVMCFDQAFLSTLDDEELRAAVAHELGHVWIFSHHPFLQTEALANDIAMRVVSRASLKKIYTKLWAHLGVSGDLSEFLQ